VESWWIPTYIRPEVWKRAQYFSCARKAIAYLEAHIAEPISLQSAANAACTERTAFSKSFRRKTGITFCSFVRPYRVSLAAAKLEKSDQPVIQIAYHVAFGDTSTFERAFKRTVGTTPSVYRARVVEGRWALPRWRPRTGATPSASAGKRPRGQQRQQRG
jgi:AraC-like DNA-binding protein